MPPATPTLIATRLRDASRMSVVGILVNASLALVKLLAGLLGNSYALVADAIESFADILSSMVVWSGLRIAAAPADEDHPYGHGKAEPLAGMLVAVMLFAAGGGIAIQAAREIRTPHHTPAAYTLAVLAGVVVVKEALFRRGRAVARATDSGAVLLDAWHHRSDAITSAAAAVGISVALAGGPGYEPADDWAALFASAVILYNATRLINRPIRELMDTEPAEISGPVRAVAESVAGVVAVEKILARKSGMRHLLDMHIEVDAEMSVRAAHAIAHEVKDRVMAAMPSIQDVLIHIEPAAQARARHGKPPAQCRF